MKHALLLHTLQTAPQTRSVPPAGRGEPGEPGTALSDRRRGRRLRRGAIVLAALAASAALASGIAPSGAAAAVDTAASDPARALARQMVALQSQVRALKSELGRLQKEVAELEDFNSCLDVIGVGRYGDSSPSEAFGYVWAASADDVYLTTALDYVEDSEFHPFYDRWFAIVDPDCVDRGARVPAARSPR